MNRERNYNKRRKRINNRESQFDTAPISIRRVAKVRSGTKRLRFSVSVVAGDRKGRVGVGLGKGPDVKAAMEKAIKYAKKNLITVPITGTTIPHEVTCKHGAVKIVLIPALPGTGVIAGGAVRKVVELAGIRDLLSKSHGSNNQLNNVYATIKAFQLLQSQRVDRSFKVKPLVSTVKIETLAEKDKKVMKKAPAKKITMPKKEFVKKSEMKKPVKITKKLESKKVLKNVAKKPKEDKAK